MQKNISTLLLCTLWVLAWTLFSVFWFDFQFGFNIFARAHWRFLAAVQSAGGNVSWMFYASIVIFAILGLGVLLLILFYPRREITNDEVIPISSGPQYPTLPTVTRPMRVTPGMMNSVAPVAPAMPDVASYTPTIEIVDALKQVFIDNNFELKSPLPHDRGWAPEIFAIGFGEKLVCVTICSVPGNITIDAASGQWISDSAGAFKSPVEKMNTLLARARALFAETLDPDVPIEITPMLLMDGGSMDIPRIGETHVFNSMDKLRDAVVRMNVQKPQPGDEEDEYNAYSGYINSAITYLNETA
ncbi:MAG: hypothetical protein LBR41_01420 [Rickettsiales bacterium]|jgi:hypothetical protein|nr:hypothetical protein [Rickettsiales bacterium]